MKRLLLFVSFAGLLPSLASAQNWDVVWQLNHVPFPGTGTAMQIVRAGLDTDEDGWGEFLCAWTESDTNAICMYEATGDNTYELVWHWMLPADANSFAGIAVGDLDNNGKVEIIVTMPSTLAVDPNPMRIWVFEWSGVQGENAYGYPGANPGEYTPTSSWNFGVADNYDLRPYSLNVEDIDKDGTNELVVGIRQSQPTSRREVLVISITGEFTGFASWDYEFEYRQSFGGSLYNVTTGDLDNDGNQEIYAFIWDLFTMRIWECTGDRQYNQVFAVDQLYAAEDIDYGALDAVRVADVNNDGVKEMYIAGTEDPNKLFIVTGVSDVSQMTSADIKEFYTIPPVIDGGFRSMQIADPDKDGKANLMIAGERDGRIYSLEYKGTGDPADSSNWDLQIPFNIWDYSGLAPGASGAPLPRLFYGSPASDMDRDGKDEYVFVNYSDEFGAWVNDAYVYVIEIDVASGVTENPTGLPKALALAQNYPNPFNPSTTIRYELPTASEVRLSVFDMLGREVSVLVNERREAGVHEVRFNATGLASGVYLCRLQVGDAVQTRKLAFIQ